MVLKLRGKVALKAVMNSIKNGLEMRKTSTVKSSGRLWNAHSYGVFTRVNNTL